MNLRWVNFTAEPQAQNAQLWVRMWTSWRERLMKCKKISKAKSWKERSSHNLMLVCLQPANSQLMASPPPLSLSLSEVLHTHTELCRVHAICVCVRAMILNIIDLPPTGALLQPASFLSQPKFSKEDRETERERRPIDDWLTSDS